MDAVIQECEKRAQRYAAQAVEAVMQVQYMITRLEGIVFAMKPALLELESEPLERARVERAHGVARDLQLTTTQVSEAITHIAQLSTFGRLQQVAFEQRQQDLRVLAEARDIAESQMTSGGVIG